MHLGDFRRMSFRVWNRHYGRDDGQTIGRAVEEIVQTDLTFIEPRIAEGGLLFVREGVDLSAGDNDSGCGGEEVDGILGATTSAHQVRDIFAI